MRNSITIPLTRSGRETRRGTLRANKLISIYNNLLAEFKSKQTGYSAIAIIGQSCIGSLAAMALLMNGWAIILKMGLLGLVTIFSMVFNASVLAQLKPKTTFNLLILSVVFNTCVIIVNLL